MEPSPDLNTIHKDGSGAYIGPHLEIIQHIFIARSLSYKTTTTTGQPKLMILCRRTPGATNYAEPSHPSVDRNGESLWRVRYEEGTFKDSPENPEKD